MPSLSPYPNYSPYRFSLNHFSHSLTTVRKPPNIPHFAGILRDETSSMGDTVNGVGGVGGVGVAAAPHFRVYYTDNDSEGMSSSSSSSSSGALWLINTESGRQNCFEAILVFLLVSLLMVAEEDVNTPLQVS